jgi:hypothetical protein
MLNCLGYITQTGGIEVCRGYFTLHREEGHTELDDLQEVDVAAYCLVMIRGFRVELSNGSGDNSGELGVLQCGLVMILGETELKEEEE